MLETRAVGGPVRPPSEVPDARAVSGRGRLGPAAPRPHPGPESAADPGPWTPDVGPWRPPCLPAPPLFPTPGFQAEFGEAVWAKAASKDAS